MGWIPFICTAAEVNGSCTHWPIEESTISKARYINQVVHAGSTRTARSMKHVIRTDGSTKEGKHDILIKLHTLEAQGKHDL
jgi:hypothetical protein